MSVLFLNEDYCLLDHHRYILNLYDKVSIAPNEFKSFGITKTVFSISNAGTKILSTRNARKRKQDLIVIHDEASSVQGIFEKGLQKISPNLIDGIRRNYQLMNSSLIRKLAKDFFESTVFSHVGISGGNDSNCSIKCNIKGNTFLIPQKSRFFCGDIMKNCNKLDGDKFDIVVADPPWWNKYIRRLKAANSKLSYSMMYNEEIASIPVKNLFADNCLVAVWCTNSPSNVSAVKDLIFPKWGVEYVAMWYWLKVTTDFTPICEFGSGCKKQPYERIILGKVGNVRYIPKDHLIISIPSALHSHKPPLLDVLKQYVVKEEPQTLELFARYLLPNTTSVGYEPLKWQHISLYEVQEVHDENV